MRHKITILFLFISLINWVSAEETCSRVAVINYQEVLVDTNSTQKGEGLRYHLDKDPVAKSYLDLYQETAKIKWQNAALGTLGTGLIVSSFLINSDEQNKKNLIIGGASILIINFLVAKTLEYANEENLNQAIKEYNKRNLPRIYFLQSSNLNTSSSKRKINSILLSKGWSF